MDTQRLIMFVVFSFSILMLWDAWQKDQHPQPTQNMPATVASSTSGVPVPSKSAPTLPHAVVPDDVQQLPKGERIKVHTDTLYVEIDTVGGDIRRLELTKHRDDTDKSKHFVLFAEQKPNTYIAQSGLIGNILPTHKTLFTVHGTEFSLATGSSDLKVKLSAPISSGIQVDKIFTFHRDSYVVDVEYQIRNGSENAISPHAYYQLVRDDSASKGDSMFISTYAGPAIYTENQKFQKVSFSDIEKNKTTHQKQSNDGWVAMLQHYFLSAWLPNNGMSREFYTKAMGNKLYAAGVILPVGSIAPGASGMISVPLYAGPQEQENLSKLAPGLDLTIDYGLLTIIAAPLFWVLSKIQGMVNNWGVAIILLTVLIKLAFYPLAAKSYRSMAHMRVLGPKLQKLKEQYGDDRQRLHQAMMELYKTEKVNPLGGCLPVVVQIPVFIALYWVLLASVEMRHAPFALWIQDLSAADPYYVLPIIMGITMIIQTKLNPTPPDPIQAKVMMVMPFAFSIFFFFFPAGLVLYWVVNNVLSIAQQWQITRSMEQLHAAKGHGKN
ncbi:MAG: membrane protein insertase YidC [Sulfurimicrobium sp.]|nr:membrane protein insertase YidC [Sulfurimicrobium sp.]MDP1705043.1 membrane protein insertase YidC [Sulfurimicrobium sp.]MDP2199974.1 membrane protein insertase YidC [Sulfurimicrobium sp.]MDP3688961.1 membrane protein insertase YidC [Sulfurimicrobium sp.]